MKFDELLKMSENSNDKNNQEAVRYLRSYQNQMSSKILRARIRNKMTKEQAAKKAQMTLDEYLSYERGTNMQATEQRYESVLKSLKGNESSNRIEYVVNSGGLLSNYSDIVSFDDHDDFNGLNQMEQQTVVNYAFP